MANLDDGVKIFDLLAFKSVEKFISILLKISIVGLLFYWFLKVDNLS